MKLCSCHGLPKAPNRACVIKRREAQSRYEQTRKGKATRTRYKRSPKGLLSYRKDNRRRRNAQDAVRVQEILNTYPELEVVWNGS